MTYQPFQQKGMNQVSKKNNAKFKNTKNDFGTFPVKIVALGFAFVNVGVVEFFLFPLNSMENKLFKTDCCGNNVLFGAIVVIVDFEDDDIGLLFGFDLIVVVVLVNSNGFEEVDEIEFEFEEIVLVDCSLLNFLFLLL